jgi:ferredoxin
MLGVLIAHALAFAALACVAARRYRLRLSRRPRCCRVWRFGAPLMLNALLLFFTFYADRLIVAGAYDWATLALYGVALQLALLPAQIVGGRRPRSCCRVCGTLGRGGSRRSGGRSCRPCRCWRWLVAGFALSRPRPSRSSMGRSFRPDAALALAARPRGGVPGSAHALFAARRRGGAHGRSRARQPRPRAGAPARRGFAALGLPLAAIAAAAAAGEAGATLRAWMLSAPGSAAPAQGVPCMTADPITDMVARNLCTGCGACAGAFPDLIRMVDDPVNGRRPVVEAGPEGRRAARRRPTAWCAGATDPGTDLDRADAIDRDWGPVLAAWEGWAAMTRSGTADRPAGR